MCSGLRPLRPADIAARPYQSECAAGGRYGALETATSSHLCLWTGVQKPQQGAPSPQGQKPAFAADTGAATASFADSAIVVKPKAPPSDPTAARASPSTKVRTRFRFPLGISQPHESHISEKLLIRGSG